MRLSADGVLQEGLQAGDIFQRKKRFYSAGMDTEENLKPEQEIKKEKEGTDNPLSFGGFLDLQFSVSERDLYTIRICEEINRILEDEDRKIMIEKVNEWSNQYEGAVEETSFPFPGCYNLDTGMTAKIQDAVVAQTEEAFDDVPTRWEVGPITNPEMLYIRSKQTKVLDYYEDTEMSNNEDLEAIRHDAFLFGLGWEAVIFEKQFERVREERVYKTLEQFIRDFPKTYTQSQYAGYLKDLTQGKEIKLIIEENRWKRYSPVRRHIKFEDCICPSEAKGIEGVNNTHIRGRRIWMKWSDIKYLEDNADYIKGQSSLLKYKPALDKDGNAIGDTEYLKKPFETFEIIYDMFIGGRKVRSLWNIELEHKICLRVIRYPYYHNRSYLIPHCIKYNTSGLYQGGLGAMLHDLHIAGNATINHILNSSLVANSLSLKARGEDTARKLNQHRWFPGSVLALTNLNDAEQFQFSTPNLSALIRMFAIIERFGSDRSGIVNYQLGMESPEDPEAPASKTFALMRKAEIKLRRYIKNLKRSEDEAGFHALQLIYQFIDTDKLSRLLGEDVSDTKEFLKPPMQVIAQSSGFVLEKIFEKRDDMQMGQILANAGFLQDPISRSKYIYQVAKSFGSNWDKKIIGIVPSPETLEEQKRQAEEKAQAKKMEGGKKAVMKAMDSGATAEEAREAGMSAMSMFENLQSGQQVMMAEGKEKIK